MPYFFPFLVILQRVTNLQQNIFNLSGLFLRFQGKSEKGKASAGTGYKPSEVNGFGLV